LAIPFNRTGFAYPVYIGVYAAIVAYLRSESHEILIMQVRRQAVKIIAKKNKL